MIGMAICERTPRVVVPKEMTELVRGQEQDLVERLEPMVKQESVSLDMSGVARIDAAGLSALIRLYCDACKAGNEFRVLRPGRHVREILGLVGLDRLLFIKDAEASRCETRFRETAA
jgi:anti-anti-sigma factor